MPHALPASPANLGTNQFCRAGEALADVRPCVRCHGLQEQQSFSASKYPILLMQHNKVMAWQWWSLLHGPPKRLADGPHPKPPPSRGHWPAAFLHANQLPQPKWRKKFWNFRNASQSEKGWLHIQVWNHNWLADHQEENSQPNVENVPLQAKTTRSDQLASVWACLKLLTVSCCPTKDYVLHEKLFRWH